MSSSPWPPKTASQAIKHFVEQLEIDYPICVDGGADDQALGPFYRWFAVDGIPYTALVDRQGKVAAIGDLEDVLAKARRLAAPQK